MTDKQINQLIDSLHFNTFNKVKGEVKKLAYPDGDAWFDVC